MRSALYHPIITMWAIEAASSEWLCRQISMLQIYSSSSSSTSLICFMFFPSSLRARTCSISLVTCSRVFILLSFLNLISTGVALYATQNIIKTAVCWSTNGCLWQLVHPRVRIFKSERMFYGFLYLKIRGRFYRYPSLSRVASTIWRPASVPSIIRLARTESPMLMTSVSSPSKPSTISFHRGALAFMPRHTKP